MTAVVNDRMFTQSNRQRPTTGHDSSARGASFGLIQSSTRMSPTEMMQLRQKISSLGGKRWPSSLRTASPTTYAAMLMETA